MINNRFDEQIEETPDYSYSDRNNDTSGYMYGTMEVAGIESIPGLDTEPKKVGFNRE